MTAARADGEGPSLDPEDWAQFRAEGHRMLDDMLDYLQQLRARPVWQPMNGALRASFREGLPAAPTALDEVYRDFTARFFRLPAATLAEQLVGELERAGAVRRADGWLESARY